MFKRNGGRDGRLAVHSLSVHFDDAGLHSRYGGILRHIVQHDGARSDHGVVSDRHRAQYFGSGSDQNIVAYCGMTFRMLLAAGSAQRHLVINRAVISDYSRFTDYNTVSMVDK